MTTSWKILKLTEGTDYLYNYILIHLYSYVLRGYIIHLTAINELDYCQFHCESIQNA